MSTTKGPWVKFDKARVPYDLYNPNEYEFRFMTTFNGGEPVTTINTIENTEEMELIVDLTLVKTYLFDKIHYRKIINHLSPREQRIKAIDSLLETSAKAQREKLLSDKNMAKSPWSEMSLEDLHGRLHDEVKELDAEVRPSWVDLNKIISEAVDIANFAGMIIEYCYKQMAEVEEP